MEERLTFPCSAITEPREPSSPTASAEERNAYWIPGAVIAASLLLGIGIAFIPSATSAFWPFSITRASEGNTTTPIVHDSSLGLLAAAINSDPNPSKGRGGVAVTEGSALIAYTGPDGTLPEKSAYRGSGRISTYTVREGDTLSEIAGMFDVSANTILWANNIGKNDLRPGMTLVILPVSGVRHTVASGDSISSLARKYQSDAQEIATYNGLSVTDDLAKGSVVIIPGGELAQAPAATAKTANSSSSNTTKKTTASTVRSGGSMGSVINTGNTTDGSFSSTFTNPAPAGRISQGIHGWNGVDIAAPSGSPIYAAAAGSVIVSRSGGWNGGYGTYVVIDHGNGVQTLYAHMSSISVSVGEKVSRGQQIGGVGNTGQSTGFHLHFEVRGGKNPFGS